jgi:hypothetical protein
MVRFPPFLYPAFGFLLFLSQKREEFGLSDFCLKAIGADFMRFWHVVRILGLCFGQLRMTSVYRFCFNVFSL